MEVDSEAAFFVYTIWVCTYIPIEGFSNLLDNGEAEAKTLAIHLRRPLHLAKAWEDLTDVFIVDAHASVLNANTQILLVCLEERADEYEATAREFDRVPHEIHQDLLDSAGVSH